MMFTCDLGTRPVFSNSYLPVTSEQLVTVNMAHVAALLAVAYSGDDVLTDQEITQFLLVAEYGHEFKEFNRASTTRHFQHDVY